VLLASALVWAFANLYGGREPYVQGVVNTGAIRVTAWQLLFVSGCFLGARWAGRTLALRPLGLWGRWVLGAIALVFVVLRHRWGASLPPSAEVLVDKLSLAPLRLINIAVAFYLFALAVRARPERLACPPLELLGRNSLAVFTAHVCGAVVVLGLGDWLAHDAIGRAVGAAMLIALMFLTACVADTRGRRWQRAVLSVSSD
jgi:hypothetical protein